MKKSHLLILQFISFWSHGLHVHLPLACYQLYHFMNYWLWFDLISHYLREIKNANHMQPGNLAVICYTRLKRWNQPCMTPIRSKGEKWMLFMLYINSKCQIGIFAYICFKMFFCVFFFKSLQCKAYSLSLCLSISPCPWKKWSQ